MLAHQCAVTPSPCCPFGIGASRKVTPPSLFARLLQAASTRISSTGFSIASTHRFFPIDHQLPNIQQHLRIDGWEHVLMDYQPIYQQEATSSNTVPLHPPESEQAHFQSTSASASITEPKPTRSSARVKAARQKEKEREQAKDREGDSAEQSIAVPLESTRATRSSTQSKNKRFREGSLGNGKSKETTEETTRVSRKYA